MELKDMTIEECAKQFSEIINEGNILNRGKQKLLKFANNDKYADTAREYKKLGAKAPTHKADKFIDKHSEVKPSVDKFANSALKGKSINY